MKENLYRFKHPLRPNVYEKKPDPRRTVFLYDTKTKNWTFGPMLRRFRVFPTCGLIHSKKHGGRPVVVVTGSAKGWPGAFSEVLDFTNTSAVWDKRCYFRQEGGKWNEKSTRPCWKTDCKYKHLRMKLTLFNSIIVKHCTP